MSKQRDLAHVVVVDSGHTAQQAKDHLLSMVRRLDRSRVTVEIVEERKTGHVSPTHSPQFDLIKAAILETRWSSAEVHALAFIPCPIVDAFESTDVYEFDEVVKLPLTAVVDDASSWPWLSVC